MGLGYNSGFQNKKASYKKLLVDTEIVIQNLQLRTLVHTSYTDHISENRVVLIKPHDLKMHQRKN